ncbi:MAG: urease accessory protein UreD [Bacteroidetes bacterium]|nr:urease accessory protein UreD [Bacteroidota bacterium]
MNAHVHISTGLRGEHTYLKNVYCTPPFKVANITEDKKAPTLHLMLMSSSPGILDGDRYLLEIDISAGNHLHLHTQSYQRLFHMKEGATQQTVLRLQPGAGFCFIPHPSVPHAGASFSSISNIHLTENNTLLWGEVLTCGRKMNGEAFAFRKYHSQTNVFIKDRLAIKENMLILPEQCDATAMGMWEGYTHHASLLYIGDHTTADTQPIRDYLDRQPDVLYGISAAPVKGLIVRLLGYKAEQLLACLRHMATLLSTQTQMPLHAY